MQLKIKAETLKEMVVRAAKGAGNNKLIPITGLMAVELRNNTLQLITTDATNYLYIKEDKVEGDDFYAVVPVAVFSKLIARMTCETVTLTEKANVLEVVGNGTYSIELPLDEEGSAVKYPDPVAQVALDGEVEEIHATTIQTILNSIKPALAVSVDVPCYTGYYVGDKVIGTDVSKIASLAVKVASEPMLISPELMNLLGVMTSEKINMRVLDDVLVFESPDCVVYGHKMEGLSSFSIGPICDLIDSKFKSTCKVSKSELLRVLDRLSLFVGVYDKNRINLTFTSDGLQISSKTSNGIEVLEYLESKSFKNFTCAIDIESFRMQVKAQAGDAVTICYGKDNAIKMVDGNLTQVIALEQDDVE